MDPQELVPLEEVVSSSPRALRPPRRGPAPPRACHRGPLRVCKLLLLLVALPASFILLPIYLRYRVYSTQMYPMSMTDMRLIDGKISPMWCQSQVVQSNATYNAYLVGTSPELSSELLPVSMSRTLLLEDDMKEYWGFYLLKGTEVTVSACVRYPGASLIMIKGYKHLQECAYIGDDSSEELDELTEAYELGLLPVDLYRKKYEETKLKLKKEDGEANRPGKMTRHKAGVSFHERQNIGDANDDAIPAGDVTDQDPKALREILEHLHAIRQAAKTEALKHFKPPPHLMALPALHRHRDANVDRDERQWLSFNDIDGTNSQQEIDTSKQVEPKITELNSTKIEPAYNVTNVVKIADVETNHLDQTRLDNHTVIKELVDNKDILKKDVEELESRLELQIINVTQKTDRDNDTKPETTANSSNIEEPNSKEVFEDVLHRLQALGDRGKRVLTRLQDTMGVDHRKDKELSNLPSNIMSSLSGTSAELDHLRQVLVEAIDEEKTRKQRQEKRRKARQAALTQKATMLSTIELKRELNEDDEERNLAQEEQEFIADGLADHHSTVNETTLYDMSNSEFWSSFSSSEEALLECAGLVLNLPLTPHRGCHEGATEDQTMHAARANALTYRVPANGYYFFVFNSENEVQQNFIHARFDLQKTRYDVTKVALRDCLNTTQRCDLTLDLFSDQKVVLEIPLRNNDSLWNEHFVIYSECEPRTSIYVICVIAVPILIILFAFQ